VAQFADRNLIHAEEELEPLPKQPGFEHQSFETSLQPSQTVRADHCIFYGRSKRQTNIPRLRDSTRDASPRFLSRLLSTGDDLATRIHDRK
jgi:hypothetical protein